LQWVRAKIAAFLRGLLAGLCRHCKLLLLMMMMMHILTVALLPDAWQVMLEKSLQSRLDETRQAVFSKVCSVVRGAML
jgi:hypothetical protein